MNKHTSSLKVDGKIKQINSISIYTKVSLATAIKKLAAFCKITSTRKLNKVNKPLIKIFCIKVYSSWGVLSLLKLRT